MTRKEILWILPILALVTFNVAFIGGITNGSIACFVCSGWIMGVWFYMLRDKRK